MMIVVYGGNASGKSVLAEGLAEKLFLWQSKEDEKSGGKVYLATMRNDGSPEAEERIAKHRKLREGKGFVTVECPVDLMENCRLQKDASVVLLEDAGNLVANVIFGNESGQENVGRTAVSEKEMNRVVEEICSEMDWLTAQTKHTIVVTNNIFDGGIEIDREMQRYSDALGAVNQWLAKQCDVFVESVCGLANVLKGQSLFEEISR